MLLYLSSDENLSQDLIDYCKTVEKTKGKELVIIKDYSPEYTPSQVTELIGTVCETYPELSASNLLPIIIGSSPTPAERTGVSFVEHCEADIIVTPKNTIEGALMDPQCPIPIGCVDRSEIESLYFFGDIVSNDQNTAACQQELFEYAIGRLMLGETDVFRQPAFEDLIRGVDAYVGDILKQSEDKEREAKRRMDSLRADLTNAIMQHKDVIQSRGNPGLVKDKIIEQFKYVLDMPEVAAATIKDKTFKVRLKDPTVIHAGDGNVYDIGLLSMYVRLDNGSVKFENHTRKISDKNHPHQNGDTMCLGEITQFVPDMVADKELAGLTKILINYANSVNLADSAGATIVNWPKVR